MNKFLTAGALTVHCLASLSAAGLPDGYERVLFVETDGGQYIDTEYYPGPGTVISGDVQMVGGFTAGVNNAIFGAKARNGFFSANFGVDNEDALFAWCAPDSTVQNHVLGARDYNGKRVTIGFDSTTGTFTYGGLTRTDCRVPTAALTTPFAVGGRLVFNAQDGQPPTPEPFQSFSMRIYGWKIWTGSTLERNYVPCVREYDRVGGLYDLQNNVFKPSAGSRPFKFPVLHVNSIGSGTAVLTQGESLSLLATPGPGYEFSGWLSESLPHGCVSGASCDPLAEVELPNDGEVTLTAVFARVDKTVPSEYERLEYVETTGEQSIDTGYFIGPNTCMDASVGMFGTFDSTAAKILYFATENDMTFAANFGDSPDYISPWFGKSYSAGGLNRKFPVPASSLGCRTCLSVDTANRVVAFGGGSQLECGEQTRRFTQSTLYIAGDAGGRTFGGFNMRIYSWTISEGPFSKGVALYDYVPCRRVRDGAVGLYERLRGDFVVSCTGTPLVAGDVWSGKEWQPPKTVLYCPGGSTAPVDYVDTKWCPALHSLTASIWVKNVKPGSQHASTYRNGAIIGQGALGARKGFSCLLQTPDECRTCKLQLQTRTASADKFDAVEIDWTQQMEDDTWHLITITHDQPTDVWCLYVDAELKGSLTQISTEPLSDCNFAIGARCAGHEAGFPVEGFLAEASLWNRVLSQKELKKLRNGPLTGRERGLVGYWPLTDDHRIVRDRVANGSEPHAAYVSGAVQAVKDRVGFERAPGLLFMLF